MWLLPEASQRFLRVCSVLVQSWLWQGLPLETQVKLQQEWRSLTNCMMPSASEFRRSSDLFIQQNTAILVVVSSNSKPLCPAWPPQSESDHIKWTLQNVIPLSPRTSELAPGHGCAYPATDVPNTTPHLHPKTCESSAVDGNARNPSGYLSCLNSQPWPCTRSWTGGSLCWGFYHSIA